MKLGALAVAAVALLLMRLHLEHERADLLAARVAELERAADYCARCYELVDGLYDAVFR